MMMASQVEADADMVMIGTPKVIFVCCLSIPSASFTFGSLTHNWHEYILIIYHYYGLQSWLTYQVTTKGTIMTTARGISAQGTQLLNTTCR